MRKIKTITLSHGDDPSWVLCPGHVTAKIFNDAFKNEGWSNRGGYKQKDLSYEYWVKRKSRIKDCKFRMTSSVPGKPGARPYTIVSWD